MGKNLTGKARLACGIVGRGHHLPQQHQQRWERQQERKRAERERKRQQPIAATTGKATNA